MAGNNWKETDYYPNNKQKAIVKDYKFDDFAAALEFVNKVGALAEKANHHPDIHFGWGYVRVWLTSHDANGVTEKDHTLAKEVDAITQGSQ